MPGKVEPQEEPPSFLGGGMYEGNNPFVEGKRTPQDSYYCTLKGLVQESYTCLREGGSPTSALDSGRGFLGEGQAQNLKDFFSNLNTPTGGNI